MIYILAVHLLKNKTKLWRHICDSR